MSLRPAVELGLWNAWILTLFYPLHPVLMLLIDRLVGTGHIFQKMGGSPERKLEQQASVVGTAIIGILVLYSIFLPLQLDTAWFYVGMVLYVLGLAGFLLAIAVVAETPQGLLFTRGPYRYSRHPLYLFSCIAFVGAGIAAASWLFLLLTGKLLLMFSICAAGEERVCIKLFGDRYRHYMRQTPRWLGVPTGN